MSSASSPESARGLEALEDYIYSFETAARQRGRFYLKTGRVTGLSQIGNDIRAAVRGSRLYEVNLRCNEAHWDATCTCPIGRECQHVYAVGLAWLQHKDNATKKTPSGASQEPPAPPPKPSTVSTIQAGGFEIDVDVGEFSAATGRAPDAQELVFLQNLASAHRALRQNHHGWFDFSTLAKLAPPNQRILVRARGRGNPFENWFITLPATPLQFWPFIALYFVETGISLPKFAEPFTRIDEARQQRDKCRSEVFLHQWKERFTRLDAAAATSPAQPIRQTVRLRLGPRKPVWEYSSGGPFAPLPAERLRELLTNSAESAQSLENNSTILLTYARSQLQESQRSGLNYNNPEDRLLIARLLGDQRLRSTVVGADGEPIADDPRPVTWQIEDHPADPGLAIVKLGLSDGSPLPDPVLYLSGQPALYLHQFRTLFRGLPPAVEPPKPQQANFALEISRAALELPEAGRFAARAGVRLPSAIAERFRAEKLHARLRAFLSPRLENSEEEVLVLELHALSPEGTVRARLQPEGWSTHAPGVDRTHDEAYLLHDFAPLAPARDHVRQFPGISWIGWSFDNARYIAEITAKSFPEQFAAWLAAAPSDLTVELDKALSGFGRPADRAGVAIEISPSSDIDWFDVHTSLCVEDTNLTEKEIDLLLKAKGRWVRLAKKGWRRIEIDNLSDPALNAELDRLGLSVDEDFHAAKKNAHRFHTLQLAGSRSAEHHEALGAQLRARAAELRAIPPPALPQELRATLRPYQEDGYRFLAHLSSLGLGGILADDMGLGKTLQSLAWLLWLRDRAVAQKRRFQALVVCPKSVVPNWQLEAARFTPTLSTGILDYKTPPDILVVNYAQLRLHAVMLSSISWDAVILDEGQNIKNPTSAAARVARDLQVRHRLVLTGTPIENRLLDLWSLLTFAQPGLLGSQAGFQRLYREKVDPAGARQRLATRVKPFLLRRTKSQVAKDLPPRVEEEIYCDLEGNQRALYEAELKQARQMLTGITSERQYASERFNILQSLLRLRQICCDPRLVGFEGDRGSTGEKIRDESASSSEKEKPASSAKMEALLDTLEPLVEEGHRVLVFSQFVTMLGLIQAELKERNIEHLLLTGQTENRQELIERFQSPDGPPVFLLSLKAGGTGLNLTAASYVVLYDPWWNPAVEAQAIDRTHRIGQTETVNAYRLIARNTIEEKIRTLQREKSAMAAAVVKEESLASVLDLESLRRILA
ncbi:MAG: DEAD/DEAH box helicase [Nibricoccus sp.]